MSTKCKVAFREQAKAVTAEVWVESDELTREEVLAHSKMLFEKASVYSIMHTMKKVK